MHSRARPRLIALGLLLTLWTLLVVGARTNSVTIDEMNHLLRGYTWLTLGPRHPDYIWLLGRTGHPPLLNVLEAVVPYLASPPDALPTFKALNRDPMAITRSFAWRVFGYTSTPSPLVCWYRPPAFDRRSQEIFSARLPIAMLTVLLAAVLFRWSCDLDGPASASFALAVLTFDPNLLAHGRLATTDAGVVALGTMALYTAGRWLRTPTRWRWALGTGLLLGATATAKTSGILWGGAVALTFLPMLIRPPATVSRRTLWLRMLAAAALAFGVIWAAYDFDIGDVHGFPIPLPAATHWNLLLFPLSTQDRPAFALGWSYYGHVWWYFPLAFLVKNPLPTLSMAALGLILRLRRSARPRLDLHVTFLLLYATAAIFWGMNIGYRHILAAQTYLALWAARGWLHLHRHSPWGRVIASAALAWLTVGTLTTFPDEIGYFNEAVLGTQGGYRVLSDSNVDWCQSYHRASQFLRQHPNSHFGPPDKPFRPREGTYVISKLLLGTMREENDWFTHHEPARALGRTYLVYEVPPPRATWVAACNVPAPPLDDATLRTYAALPEAYRHLTFDCTQSWLYPEGGHLPGLYLLHHDLVPLPRPCWPFPPQRCERQPNDAFMARHVAMQHLAFEQPRPRPTYPAFLLYESAPPTLPPPPTTYAAPAGTPPSRLTATALLTSPLVGGTLRFLTTSARPEGHALEVETWWAVETGPTTRPFSLMGHLITAEGESVAVADGLGVNPLELRPGDILVQRHRFEEVNQAAELWLRIGAYWLETMERWPVNQGPADALFVPLGGRDEAPSLRQQPSGGKP